MFQSIEFQWDPKEYYFLEESCKQDDGVQLSLEYMTNKEMKVLEAGCGSGRAVKYFSDLGYKNVHGIELNKETVQTVNKIYPQLDVIQGNILSMPYDDNSFDLVVSYGVVEHFPKGLEAPLHSLWKVLKPGGIAIITIPSFNKVRQIKYFLGKPFRFLNFRENNHIRKLFNKPLLPKVRNEVGYLYYVYPQFGDFFEYRLKPKEFEEVCLKTGFKIVESLAISHIDGLYHESGFFFRSCLLKYKDWSFEVSRPAFFLNRILKRISFFHNHMHACVLEKPQEET
jgi:SAM-dependent methyltransferase